MQVAQAVTSTRQAYPLAGCGQGQALPPLSELTRPVRLAAGTLCCRRPAHVPVRGGSTLTSKSRRRFLAQGALALPVWVAARPGRAAAGVEAAAVAAASTATWRAVAHLVLPTSELSEEDLGRILAGFEEWQAGLEPVAELDHPYLDDDEIAYGPADPRPRWQAQVEALEIEAQKRHQRPFAALERASAEAILRRQLPHDLDPQLPHPTLAPHAAIALAAWFFGSPEANDLCYRARIGRYDCRGLPTAPDEPAALEDSPWEAR